MSSVKSYSRKEWNISRYNLMSNHVGFVPRVHRSLNVDEIVAMDPQLFTDMLNHIEIVTLISSRNG